MNYFHHNKISRFLLIKLSYGYFLLSVNTLIKFIYVIAYYVRNVINKENLEGTLKFFSSIYL